MASCTNNGTATTISANHGHVLVVSKADVVAGAEKTYSIQGTALHDHLVTVTASDFALLAANTTIMKVSTETDHSHTCTVMCV